MEPPSPARALLAAGATVLVVAGGGTVLPGSSAVRRAGQTPDATVLPGTAARTAGGRTSARYAGSISVNRRSAVASAYHRRYAPGLEKGTGYTGSDSRCRPGTTAPSSRAATQSAINFVRALNGLAPVRFSSTLNARSQRTALIMSANRSLSHAPPRGWRCWTRVGAANAARSNLALSYPSITSSGLVGLYLREPGAGNVAVGHRRWLLNPFSTTMGSGSTHTANAITVIGPTAARRPNPPWVSWPSAGYFPQPLEPGGRWSLSAGNRRADFRRATVRVYRNGHRVRAVKQRVHPGYAMPTMVWQIPAKQARSGTYRVVVSGVHRSGTRKVFARSYTVRLFTP